MSKNNKKNKQEPVEKQEEKKQVPSVKKSNVVKMKFSEHKYYNDLNIPMFEAGKVYELEGDAWIARWLKRGGEIVEGELQLPAQEEPNLSEIVAKEEVKVETQVEKPVVEEVPVSLDMEQIEE